MDGKMFHFCAVAEKQIEGDDEAGLLLTKSVLKLFETDTK